MTAPVVGLVIAGRVPALVVSILLLLLSLDTTAMLVKLAWDAGNVAPVQVKAIAPAAIELADNVTFNAPPVHEEEAGELVPAGDVKSQTGVTGNAKPVK